MYAMRYVVLPCGSARRRAINGTYVYADGINAGEGYDHMSGQNPTPAPAPAPAPADPAPPPTPAPAATGPTGPTAPTGPAPVISFTAEQQAAVDRIVTERLAREREQDAQRIAAAAETARIAALREAGNDKDAAAELQKQVDALTPKAGERDAAIAVIEKMVQSRKANAPAHIVALLEKQPLTEQLAYIEEHEAAWSEPTREPIVPQPRGGNGGGTPTAGKALIESRYGRAKTPATG